MWTTEASGYTCVYIYIYIYIYLSGILAVNANRKNVTHFFTSNLGVVDSRKGYVLSNRRK